MHREVIGKKEGLDDPEIEVGSRSLRPALQGCKSKGYLPQWCVTGKVTQRWHQHYCFKAHESSSFNHSNSICHEVFLITGKGRSCLSSRLNPYRGALVG
jgi:hypothetical protein